LSKPVQPGGHTGTVLPATTGSTCSGLKTRAADNTPTAGCTADNIALTTAAEVPPDRLAADLCRTDTTPPGEHQNDENGSSRAALLGD
jgi:hypothetical protein